MSECRQVKLRVIAENYKRGDQGNSGNVSYLVSVKEDGVPFFVYRPKYIEEEAPHEATDSKKLITGNEDGKGHACI